MILTKTVEIKINRYAKYYSDLGYDIKGKSIITIPVEHLMKTSHQRITVKCDYCENIKELEYRRYLLSYENGNKYSCNKCSHNKNDINNLKKYGVKNVFELDSIKEKIKTTNLEKYGSEFPNQSELVKNKRKNSNIKKYGVVNVFELDETKDKMKITNLEKYGSEYANQSKLVRDKIKLTNLKLYGFEFATQNKNVINKSNITRTPYLIDKSIKCFNTDGILSIDFDTKIYTLKCDCGKNHNYEISNKLLNVRKYTCKTTLCTICNPLKSLKGRENQLYDFIFENYNGKILRNTRKTLDNKYEIDVYLPELKIGFEFNGTYWHNEDHKNKGYHKDKFECCFNKNINLIYIWENDWLDDNENIKNNILYILNKPKKIINYKIIKFNKNIQIKFDNKTIQADIKNNIIYNIINDDNYDLLPLYKYIKNNNLTLMLNTFSNILNYDFELLNTIEKKIYFEKGNYNFYDIDKIYLKAI